MDISLLYSVFTPALGSIKPYMQLVSTNIYPGLKRQWHEADHLPSSSAEAKNRTAIPPFLLMFTRRDA
jgi:hypothetical protein